MYGRQLTVFIVFGMIFLVNGTRNNIALQGTATQSSTLNYLKYNWSAAYAIDGNTGFNVTCRCCSGTNDNETKQSWWELDLGSVYNIGRIDVYGRSDDIVDQLQGFSLYLSNTSQSTTDLIYRDGITEDQYITKGGHYVIAVGKTLGRYVRITVHVKTLILCEVRVFEACPDGQYEPNCDPCNCGGGPCNKTDGTCTECPVGRYGVGCFPCGPCLLGIPCNNTTGNCPTGCEVGYYGNKCNQDCKVGYFGTSCDHECHCDDNQPCDKTTGTCLTPGCKPGWSGQACNEICSSPSFGSDCSHTCHCINGRHCNHVTGTCDLGVCNPGWSGASCDSECESPSFGPSCSYTCHCINGSHCNHVTGTCGIGVCDPGWKGTSCDSECESPVFGPNCSESCHCINSTQCDHVTGSCNLDLCEPGWQGPSCNRAATDLPSRFPQSRCKDGSEILKYMISLVVILAVACVGLIVCVIVLWTKLRKTRKNITDKRTEADNYVNEMIERTANNSDVAQAPENHYHPVVNVDGVSVDVHRHYMTLNYRDNTDGEYARLDPVSRHESAHDHGYSNIATSK